MKTTSSNAYASGSNQNCGNVLTDRPVVGGVRQAPGGRTSIVLGGGISPVKQASPAKAPASPGKEENEDDAAEIVKENIPMAKDGKDPLWSAARNNIKAADPTEPRKLEASFEQLRSTRAPPGGQSNIVFG